MFKRLNLRIDSEILNILNISSVFVLEKELKFLFSKHFSSIHFHYVSDQLSNEFGNKFNNNYPIVSLDPYTKTEYNLSISRLYDKTGTDFLGYTTENREDILTQINKIPFNSKINLFDDDIGNGFQIRFIQNLLEFTRKIQIISINSYIHFNSNTTEVLDLHDFWKYSELSGLFVESDTQITRVLYHPNTIDFTQRTSIKDLSLFSKDYITVSNNLNLAKYMQK